MKTRFSLIFLFSLVLSLFADKTAAQFYNGSQMTFGKNRVQYNGFLWQSENYERFKIYYYIGGKTHGAYVAQAAHKYLSEIEKLFDFYIEEKIEFVVYNSQSQFKQSNIGVNGDEMYNIGGVTRIVGSKVFLYYEGDHKKLDQQIRGAISNILLMQMMYGGNWKDVLKNSTLMSLPDWYVQGFTSYVANPWDVETEGYVKDGILSGRYNRYYRLEGLDAQYAGHAMWNYIAEVYGEGVIPNILYMTRISRNVESGFLFVLGVGLKKLTTEYVSYYRRKFEDDEKIQMSPTLDTLELKNKKNTIYYQFKTSPDGRYAAFVSNKMGQYKIYLYDISKKELKRIAKGEQKLNRINDYSFPVLGWHPSGAGLGYVIEKKGEVYFCTYSVEEEKVSKKVLGKVEKVLSFDYSNDGKTLIFSAVANGQTDLFYYRPAGNAIEQITNDIYDDLHPKFAHKDTKIIFASNRLSDTIQRETVNKPYPTNRDIFVYNIKERSRYLQRITNTPFADELMPSQIDTLNYTYISDENGVWNRYMAFYDSAIASVDTVVHYTYFTKVTPLSNFNRNILEYDVNEKKGNYSLLMLRNGKYIFYNGKIKNDQKYAGELPNTRYRIQQKMAMLKANQALGKDSILKIDPVKIEIQEQHIKLDSGEIDIYNYRFNEEKPTYEKETVKIEEAPDKKSSDTTKLIKPKKEVFKPAPSSMYKKNFATDYIVSQLDNNYLNQTYQRYTPGVPYFNPGINGLFKIGISDVFEDYRIIGGFRFAGNLGSNEYMLAFQDYSKRLDKQYTAYRQSFNAYSRDLDVTKTVIHLANVQLKYPFNEVLSLRGTMQYRNDRVVTLATDASNLNKKNSFYHQAGAKLELVFDNTIPKGVNLFNGLRFKVWGEYYREFITEQSNFIVTGFDVRHYLKINRDFIWANRIAGSASFGDKLLLYYLGGVDNWIAPKYDYQMQVATDQNYAYQTIATPVRGFFQNTRNGSKFAVINSELRMPIVKYFAEKPLKSNFLENFQIVGFFDVGSAWTGWNPYSSDNSFNTIVYSSPGNPVIITIINQREPIIYGYGWGLRSRLFGYFIRFDWAWGVDDGVRFAPVKYFSLSLDF